MYFLRPFLYYCTCVWRGGVALRMKSCIDVLCWSLGGTATVIPCCWARITFTDDTYAPTGDLANVLKYVLLK